jgi:hypothetical protein
MRNIVAAEVLRDREAYVTAIVAIARVNESTDMDQSLSGLGSANQDREIGDIRDRGSVQFTHQRHSVPGVGL